MRLKRAVPGLILSILITLVAEPLHASDKRPISPQVVNGDPVRKGQYRFMVAIQAPEFADESNPYGHLCGGSLISPKFILTAAHCILFEEPYRYQAVVGMTTYGENQGKPRNIVALHVHPLYETGG